ncbi:MAG: hypothetical protein ACI8TP_002439 [Acidimicrobiales bacterium]|jgi:hypothetical protein
MYVPAASRVFAIAALSLLASCGVNDAANSEVSNTPQDTIQTAFLNQTAPSGPKTAGSCPGVGDVFELAVPGTYTAFAIGPSGSMATEMRGLGGEVLATTQPAATNVARVDIAAAARFDISPPQIFEVETEVTIHVQHSNSPYELVLVRIGDEGEFALDIRPPVEHVVSESGSCPNGDSPETFRILTDAVYSAPDARQVFLIESPGGRL